MEAYIVSGLVSGSIYAISALGLVLTYKSSRVFNFAHGAIAFSVAIFYYWLTHENGWSIPAAAIMSILVVAPLIGLILWAALFRRLTHTSPTIRLVSTVGLWVALPALTKILFPFSKDQIFEIQGFVKYPLSGPDVFRVFGVSLNWDQGAVLLSAAAIALVTSLLLRFTPIGLSTRATVDSPRNAGISGINTAAVTASSWMLGTMLAGLAGVLLAPILGLEEFQFTLLLVASFAAAVVGRMTSLPLTFVGAIGIGLVQGIWVKFQPDSGFLSKGVQASIPFVVMLVFLLGYSGLQRERFEVDPRAAGSVRGEAPAPPPSHGWRRLLGPLGVVILLASFPILLNDFWVGVISQGVALAIVFLSYTLVTGEGGMLSLCQITLAGIGGFAAARLATEAGWPVWIAILAGALIAVPFGLLVSLPSLRVGDLYLALATLAFALLIENLVFTKNEFDNFGAGVEIGRPFGIGSDDRVAMYILLGVVFGVIALLVVNVRRSTSGLVFASMRSSEPAAVTVGISVVRAKLIAFTTSAFVAGLGGALYSATIGRASVVSFSVLIGIVWLAVVVTWGVRSVFGALMAGIIFVVFPQWVTLHYSVFGLFRLSDGWADVPTLLFGLGAIGLAREPRGVIFDVVNQSRLRRLRRENRRAAAPGPPAPDQPTPDQPAVVA